MGALFVDGRRFQTVVSLETAREIKFFNVARCWGDVAARICGPPH